MGGAHGDFCKRKQLQGRKDSSLYFVSQGIDYDKVFGEFERICKGVNLRILLKQTNWAYNDMVGKQGICGNFACMG